MHAAGTAENSVGRGAVGDGMSRGKPSGACARWAAFLCGAPLLFASAHASPPMVVLALTPSPLALALALALTLSPPLALASPRLASPHHTSPHRSVFPRIILVSETALPEFAPLCSVIKAGGGGPQGAGRSRRRL